MKQLISSIAVLSLILAVSAMPVAAYAKGGGGGGRGGGSFSSSRSYSSPKPSTAPSVKPSVPKPSAPVVAPVKTPTVKPPAPVKVSTTPTKATPTVTAATAKTVNGKTYSKTGNVVGGNYYPSFRGGYVAPAGSTVYYRDSGSDWMMWIPLMYMMTHDSHREAIVQEPQIGTSTPPVERVVKEEGIDTMYVVNIVMSVLALGAIAVGLVWLVNHLTSPKRKYV